MRLDWNNVIDRTTAYLLVVGSFLFITMILSGVLVK